mmetsp:Transcript_81901/g.144948  ORF Transcript_81901/g.144948 Transcript_81901/m.144948 type:complete len:670 (-) Transcript_81901:126-2135(-)
MYRAAIVGLGPAGIGPLIAAARAGALNKWLRDGVALIDKGSRPGFGKFGQYLITANTTAAYTIDPFLPDPSMTPKLRKQLRLTEEDPILEEIRQLPTFTKLQELADKGAHVKATLREYGEFSEEVAKLFLQRLEEYPQSTYHPNTTVETIQFSDGVGSPLIIRGDSVEMHAKSLLLSTGGKPKMPQFGAAFDDKLRSSDYIQREKGMQEVKDLLAQKAKIKIAVIGGSHSAFSTSQLLLNTLPDADIHISMLHRGQIRVYYDSEADAAAAGYKVQPGTVCAVSGQVNRYGGIRSPVRELYQEVNAGAEKRLSFVSASATGADSDLFYSIISEADLIVPAFGYTAALPKLLATNGDQLPWATDEKDGQALMNNYTSQLSCVLRMQAQEEPKYVSSQKVPLPNVFGSGLGFGLQSGGELKIGESGVRIDGQAQYHSWVGVMNLNGLAKSTVDAKLPDLQAEHAILASILTRRWMKHSRLLKSQAEWTVSSHDTGMLESPQRPQRSTPDMLEWPGRSVLQAQDITLRPLDSLEDDCRAAFQEWDLDVSGVLTTREISEKLQNVGLHSSIEQLNALVLKMNGGERDFVVTQQEFINHFKVLFSDLERLRVATRSVFDIIDADGTGQLNASELQRHAMKFGNGFLSLLEAELMLKTLRVDGPVDFDAFARLSEA